MSWRAWWIMLTIGVLILAYVAIGNLITDMPPPRGTGDSAGWRPPCVVTAVQYPGEQYQPHPFGPVFAGPGGCTDLGDLPTI